MPNRFPTCKLILFALLSLSDFVITYMLLSGSSGRVYESNPVADQWLQQGGWSGLAMFKAMVVFGVSIIAVYIYWRRPRLAHDLLAVACGAVVVAVVTGTSIAMSKPQPAAAEETDTGPIVVDMRDRQPPPPIRDYDRLLEKASYSVTIEQMDLANAVALLEQSDRAGKAEWLEALRQAYPGVEDRALLAADVIQNAVGSRIRTRDARNLAERLEREFQELYGFRPELPYQQLLHLAPQSQHRETTVASAVR